MAESKASTKRADETKDEAKQGGTRPFSTWLAEQRGGDLQAELSDELAELADRVLEYDKPGKLTLTIQVKPQEGAQMAVVVTDQVKAAPPEPPKPASLFFADKRGLSRRDPRQAELPLRTVGGEKPEPRDAKE